MRIELGEPPRASDPDGFDLCDPAAYERGGAHGLWRLLRETAPVRRDVAPNGTPFWSFFKYAECEKIVKDAATYSSESGTILASVGADDPAGGKTITLMDPPDHSKIRRPAMRHFSQAHIRHRDDEIRKGVLDLIEPLAAGVVHDVAVVLRALPMIAAGPLIGIPADHWDSVAFHATSSIAPDDPNYAIGRTTADTLRRAHHHLFTAFSATLRESGEEGSRSLMAELAGLEIDGRSVDERALMLNAYSFSLGANSTTSHVASHLLLVLAEQPAVWQQVVDDPSVLDSLIDEAVRWSSPTNHLVRRVRVATELGGVQLAPGEWVCGWVASANRDDDVFDRPYVFDPRRAPNQHLGFGGGPHYCIGAPASRLLLHIMLAEFARRRVRFELAGEPAHLRSNWINGITSLPMRILPNDGTE